MGNVSEVGWARFGRLRLGVEIQLKGTECLRSGSVRQKCGIRHTSNSLNLSCLLLVSFEAGLHCQLLSCISADDNIFNAVFSDHVQSNRWSYEKFCSISRQVLPMRNQFWTMDGAVRL